MRSNKGIYTVLGILVCIIILVMVLAPVKVNWTPTYRAKDKIRLGTKATFELSKHLFKPNNLVLTQKTFEAFASDTLSQANFIVIDPGFYPTEVQLKNMYTLANRGCTFFIVCSDFSGNIEDEWLLSSESTGREFDPEKINDAPTYVSTYDSTQYPFRAGFVSHTFSEDKGQDVSFLSFTADQKPILAYKKMGKGGFYLHLNPLMFTNYAILEGKNHEYISKVFSYLPSQPTYWSEAHFISQEQSQSPLRAVFEHPASRMAWFTLIVLVIVYMTLYSKRRQHVIPVLEPLQNETLKFTQIVAQLYFNQKQHQNLALKKINYFFETIRRKYRIDTSILNSTMTTILANRSGVPLAETEALIELIKQIQKSTQLDEQTLVVLNKKIESFNEKAN